MTAADGGAAADGAAAPPPAARRQHRVLMVCDFFWPGAGGVEAHVFKLAQRLLAAGHYAVILTRARPGAPPGVRHLANGLRVYYAPRRPVALGASLPTVLGTFALVRRVALRERIDLVHAHQAFSPMAHEAALAARTMDLRLVFTDHSLFGFADAGSILVNKCLKLSLADAHAVICVSHTAKENTVLRACVPPARVHVVPNAVDAGAFAAAAGARPRGPPPGRLVVLCLSRLVYRKGVDLLAAALPALAAAHPDVDFVVGGDGPKRRALEAAVAAGALGGRVRLAGAVAPADVPAFLAQGHVFLNASLTEAFCIALVEAAAAGLAVVSTAVGGVPEVLPPGVLELAEPSAAGLVAATGAALARVRAGGVDAAAQHAAVAAMYSWRDVAARTERVYAAAAASARDDSWPARAGRLAACGRWFGPLACAVAAAAWLWWRLLEALQPARRLRPAVDFPTPWAGGRLAPGGDDEGDEGDGGGADLHK
jgi:phosphatidylinositol glycan class A protein